MKEIAEQPIWDEGVEFPQFSSLAESTTTEVVVIGGGLTGVLTAYLLTRAGSKVVLLEADRMGHGATGMTTAFLTQYLDTNIQDLVKVYGLEPTRHLLAAHGAAIDAAEDIIAREIIECEFMRCPNYIYANDAADRSELEAERTAGEEIGLTFSWIKEKLPFAHEGSLLLENQAKFHPLRYLAALTRLIQQRGGQIYENTEVTNVEPQGDGGVKITTKKGHDIQAEYAVVATYAPFNKKLFFKKAHYKSYVLSGVVERGRLPEAIYEDSANPYHYWRIDQPSPRLRPASRESSYDRFIFGGADHRADIPVNAEKNYTALSETLAHTFGDIPHEVRYRWKGPILETVDGLAYLGPVDTERILYATGFSGNGMTYAHIAAQSMVDHIQGTPNPLQEMLAARRAPTLRALAHKGRDYSEELLGGAVRNTFRRPGIE